MNIFTKHRVLTLKYVIYFEYVDLNWRMRIKVFRICLFIYRVVCAQYVHHCLNKG